jgi:hypothetical protein
MIMYLVLGFAILIFLLDVVKMFAKWAVLFSIVLTFLIAFAGKKYGISFEDQSSCYSDAVGKTETPVTE